ncbi:5'-nucleotidase C-terminal domain-containing protein [Natronomonas sp. LN261]|uniref:bifunctional metallophosphatase/5'-nucleotidase n=1 Tax=Natronomonas sp. LN261 TaxID=2750669 RepID=UPI0015EF03D3
MGVRLLHYSDVENAHDDPATIARLAGTIESIRDDRTLVCGTGDNVAPGVLPLVSEGQVALAFFEAISPDVETFGNHDFDFGPERTAEIVRRSPQRWLSANVRQSDEPFAGVDPWCIERVGGDSVGFFGVTDPTTPSIGDGGGLEFEDPIAAAREAVGSLRERDVDYVVALSHLGREDDRLAAVCDVDVVLGGHVHSERIGRIHETVLTRPGSGGRTLLEVDLPSGEVTRHDVAEGPFDAELAARYRDRIADTGLDTVVGHVPEPIARTDTEAFRGESRVGNFVADAYRWAAAREFGTDRPVVGLQNSGGIRTGPPLSGAVTAADLVSLVPFDEPLVVAELTGRELRSVFAEAADTPGFGEADWWHAHVSGARLRYDHDDDRLCEATVGGDPIVDDEPYRLAVSAFLLCTDVEFPTLTEEHVVERLDTQYEILIEYADAVGIDPTVEGRIVRSGV